MHGGNLSSFITQKAADKDTVVNKVMFLTDWSQHRLSSELTSCQSCSVRPPQHTDHTHTNKPVRPRQETCWAEQESSHRGWIRFIQEIRSWNPQRSTRTGAERTRPAFMFAVLLQPNGRLQFESHHLETFPSNFCYIRSGVFKDTAGCFHPFFCRNQKQLFLTGGASCEGTALQLYLCLFQSAEVISTHRMYREVCPKCADQRRAGSEAGAAWRTALWPRGAVSRRAFISPVSLPFARERTHTCCHTVAWELHRFYLSHPALNFSLGVFGLCSPQTQVSRRWPAAEGWMCECLLSAYSERITKKQQQLHVGSDLQTLWEERKRFKGIFL